MAAPAFRADELLYTQGADIARAAGASEEFIQQNRKLQEELFAIVVKEKDPKTAEQKLRDVFSRRFASLPEAQRNEVLGSVNGQIQLVNSPDIRYWLSYDPPRLSRR